MKKSLRSVLLRILFVILLALAVPAYSAVPFINGKSGIPALAPLNVGDFVVAVGNPFGLGGTVMAGRSARHRNFWQLCRRAKMSSFSTCCVAISG